MGKSESLVAVTIFWQNSMSSTGHILALSFSDLFHLSGELMFKSAFRVGTSPSIWVYHMGLRWLINRVIHSSFHTSCIRIGGLQGRWQLVLGQSVSLGMIVTIFVGILFGMSPIA